MKNFITLQNFWYRIQQLVILILHLFLLGWMYYVLSHSGAMATSDVFSHFAGMSLMGAILIRGCAYWANYYFQKEKEKVNK